MTRAELVRALAERHGLTRREAARVVGAVLDGVEASLRDGYRVEIRGFGTWRARSYPAYQGRNPRTGERVPIAPKVLPVYRPGKALLARVAGEEEG